MSALYARGLHAPVFILVFSQHACPLDRLQLWLYLGTDLVFPPDGSVTAAHSAPSGAEGFVIPRSFSTKEASSAHRSSPVDFCGLPLDLFVRSPV